MKSKFNKDITVDTQFMAYTMDYETNEIVMRIMVNDGEFGEIRLCEKDVKRIYEWFDLAKIIKEKEKWI